MKICRMTGSAARAVGPSVGVVASARRASRGSLALLADDLLEHALRSCRRSPRIGRQEDHADTVVAGGRQADA